jgi:predicted CXXCH cytochrome family protein
MRRPREFFRVIAPMSVALPAGPMRCGRGPSALRFAGWGLRHRLGRKVNCCLSALILFAAGCSKEKTASSPQTSAQGLNFQEMLPAIRGPSGYVGSKACKECHEDQYGSWHRSYHRTMTQVVSDESVQASFENVVLTNDAARFTLNSKDGEYWVRMEPLVSTPSENGTPAGLEQRLGLVTGSHHMQVFWVPEGNGNLQLGFPFTWLIPEKRWVPRNSTFVRPPDMQHRAEIWNAVCSRCHTTGVQPHLNFAARTARTEVAELGISCEACHGPGGRHVQAQKYSTSAVKSVQPGEIVHPKKISAERSAQTCGFCHSMKWMDKNNDWRENGFEFRPGDDLEKTTPIIRPSQVDAIPGLKEYLAKNPDLLRDFFWPDGMIRVSGREFNGIIESACYKSGKFSCVSCHSLHESEPEDQLAEKAKGNGACIQCHDKFRDTKMLMAHTHHAANSSGSECYNCHMPYTSYGILKAIRSHQISNPKVASDLTAGRPNACNLCHIDRTLAWSSDRLTEWYGQAKTVLPEEKLSHLANLALKGDAGQRVLAAWHLSWKPALQASATNLVQPLLAQLLDDPYAAVRCVAERSSRTNGLLVPEIYDYTIDPRARAPVRDQIWKDWEATSATPDASENFLLGNGRIDRGRFEELLRQRNDRAVRLRE